MSGPGPENPIPEQKAGQQQNRNTLLVIGPCLAVKAGCGPIFFWECSFACPAAEARGIQSFRDGPIAGKADSRSNQTRFSPFMFLLAWKPNRFLAAQFGLAVTGLPVAAAVARLRFDHT